MGFNVECVNFGRYLEDKRISHGVTIEELAVGICDCSLITKLESGERISSMLMRNRLLERIGATSEEYERFVSVEEFEDWKKRTLIVDFISERKCQEAKEELAKYHADNERGDIFAEQFYFDMLAMISKLEKNTGVVEYAEKALRKTVVINKDGIVTNKKLAPKEINLIIEYSAKLGKYQRREQLQRLLSYADNNILDGRNLVLFYPKLVWTYVSENLYDYMNDNVWLMRALKMVEKAMTCLSETDRLMYMLELSSVKKRIWQHILESSELKKSIGYEFFLEDKKKSEDEFILWKSIGDEFGVDLKADDWCYLYREEGVKCIGDIIKRRRNMIGMSAEELCIDICTVETLERIEKLKRTPQPKRMKRLFERLGLVGEYQKTFISVTDSEIKRCSEDVTRYSNSGEYDKALAELNHLYTILVDRTPEDEQFLLMTETMIRYRRGEISNADCIYRLNKSLKYTLSEFDFSQSYYLRRNELTCIYNIVMARGGEIPEEYGKFFMDLCHSMLNDRTARDTRVLEVFMLAAIRIQICKGNYDEAERLSEKLVQIELQNKRSNVLYSAFNVRILIFEQKMEAGEMVEKCRIKKNDYYTAAMKCKQNG